MELFPLTKDAQALMLRITASLERVDTAVAEAQVLTRNVNELVTEMRTMVGAFKSAAATGVVKP